MQMIPISDLPTVDLPVSLYPDMTAQDPALRRILRECRGKVRRKARRERIAAKRSFLEV